MSFIVEMGSVLRLLTLIAALAATGAKARADVVIGVAVPITGPNAAFGAQIVKGVELAAKDINAAGGINGEQIVLVTGDDSSDRTQGISVANRFVADGVKYVVGHFSSGVSIPASEIYAEKGILQITPSSTNPTFTEHGLWNTFRTCRRDDLQGAVAGGYLATNFKDSKIAIVHDKTPYGQGLADITKRALNRGGVTEVVNEGINVGDKDFSALIGKMRDAGVSVVYYGGLFTELGLIEKQAVDQGLKATFMSGDSIVSNELASIAGDAVDGTLMTFAPDPRMNPAAQNVVAEFRAAGFEPEAHTLHAYAALQVIAEAAKKSGSADDPSKVASVIKASGPWTTVIGELGYDAKGDITRPDYVIYEWRKGDDGDYSYFPRG